MFHKNNYQRLHLLFQEYLQIRPFSGSICELSLPYVSMAKTLLTLIRGSREDNFLLHLEIVERTVHTGFPMIELITQVKFYVK